MGHFYHPAKIATCGSFHATNLKAVLTGLLLTQNNEEH